MKKFWELNKTKVILLFVSIYVVGLLFFCLSLHARIFDKGHEVTFLIPLIFSLALSAVFVIRGTIYFSVIDKIKIDTSQKSITPLFDNGFVLELDDQRKLLLITKQLLHGTISGYPVKVSFRLGNKYNWPIIKFTFTVSSINIKETSTEESIWFKMPCFPYRMVLLPQLRKDIKPEVLDFIEGLKEKGYTPAAQ